VRVSPAATLVQALEPVRSDPTHGAVLLDVDGTLAPIVEHAEDAHVPEATRALLIEVTKRYGLVACVSGRRAQAARQIVAIGSIAYVGNHGGELLPPGSTKIRLLDSTIARWGERVAEFAEQAYSGQLRALRVRREDKGIIIAFHWRGARNEDEAEAALRLVAKAAEDEGLGVHWGRKVLEIRPPVELEKGRGIAALFNEVLSSKGARGRPGAERAESDRETAKEGDAGERAQATEDAQAAEDEPSADDAQTTEGAPAIEGGQATERAHGHDAPPVEDGRGDAAEPALSAAIYVGDDLTDLDAFRELRRMAEAGTLKSATCVAVASEEAPAELLEAADLVVDGPSEVRALLAALL
jgi:trehalose 6-phosphate phosphatase